jgi:hypothetical protein
MRGRGQSLDASVLVVAALTVVGFALRVRGFHEGLYQDELLSLADTGGRSLSSVLDTVANGGVPGYPLENNPPLYFVLAWVGEKAGDPTASIRLPSLILGTATVPLVYLVGARTVGRQAAIVGAAFIVLSPFAIFYGIEARPYATLMFLSCLSTLMLLSAVEARRVSWWWAGYAASVAAVLYTHYTGVFVIVAQGAWTLWNYRDRWRVLLLSYAGAAIAYLPWLPHLRGVGAGPSAELARIAHVNHGVSFVQWLVGSPRLFLVDMPSVPALALLGCGVAVGVLAWILALARRAPNSSVARRRLGPAGALVPLLALSTPVCLLLYGVVGNDLFLFPRNLTASLPFAALALGWLLTPPKRLARVGAIGLAGLGIGVGAVRTLDERFQRPNFPAVARLLDASAGPRDPVVYYGASFEPFILSQALPDYYERPHLIKGSDLAERSVARAFSAPATSVFLVEVQWLGVVPPPSVAGWVKAGQHEFPGIERLTVASYEKLRPRAYSLGPSFIAPFHGPAVHVVPERMTGAVDGATVTALSVTLSGWAARRDHSPVERVIAFAAGRLVGVDTPTSPRPDLGGNRGGGVRDLGFSIAVPRRLARDLRHDVRLFAVADGFASQLPLYCSPTIRLAIGC